MDGFPKHTRLWAAESAELPSLWDTVERAAGPQAWPGQADPRFAEQRNRPWESEQPLFPAEEMGEGAWEEETLGES